MANISFKQNILPKTDNTYYLGNSSYKWHAYLATINGSPVSNLFLPAVTSSDNGKILKVSNGQWTAGTLDISGKADKVSSATAGDVATLDSNGNLVDSGKTLGISIPTPTSGDTDKFFKGDGTWAEVSSGGETSPVEDKPFSVTVADWTLVSGEYKAEISNSSITAECLVDVMYDKNFRDYVPSDVFSEKSTGKITLYTDVLPTGTITGNIRIFMGDISAVGETKADKVSGAIAGHLASLNSNGNLLDSGKILGISIPEPASGDSSKFLRGDGTWAQAATDISGKADKVSSATDGNFAGLDANGNLTDSGHKHSDYLTSHQDISGKADKVTSATNGNFAALDSNGNLTDSGHKHSDYLTSHQDITGKADKVTSATAGDFAALDSNGNLTDSGKSASSFAVPSSSLSLTATSVGWSNATPTTQTITATGVTASNNIAVGEGASLTTAQRTAMIAAQLACTAQGANSITLTCYGTTPTVDLPITVVILG